ncbi:hypothetical protein MPNT_10347 [Candidatus Methylacidithermus pantelleriae]|uniref:TonB-dependent receptor-like beta-barrel domain-containing protein n=2 Tax=Candidatus Methylacidithermus pantelleriae TaxID=2744239 RepID=A0A8J2FMT1_9BACT|nr:hypothetical protein MPNT_10347 [Candidatus Methylacidithermus pantelleriae]
MAPRQSQRDFPNERKDKRTYEAFLPKIGVLVQLSGENQLYANLSRSFEAPSFVDLFPFGPTFSPSSPELRPLSAQKATTLEVGSRGTCGALGWDVAFYHSWVTQELLTLLNPQGTVPVTRNADRTRHLGVEVGNSIVLAKGLVHRPQDGKPLPCSPDQDRILLRQSYLWSDFFFDHDPQLGNLSLGGVPEHFYRAQLLYEHPCGFYAGPNVEWVPQRYPADHANTLFSPGYTIMGFDLGWHSLKNGWSFFLSARNLSDEKYIALVRPTADARGKDASVFLPGEGRAVYGGIQWSW